MTKIKEALQKRFKKHRVLFWYDDKEEFREQFEELSLNNVEKIHVAGNEFAIKYRIHKIAPKQQFLLYFTTPKPANEENWLLDMELAYDVFYTDQQALFLQELGLGYHFKELVGEHFLFFKKKERLEKLKELLDGDETERALKYKLLAVVFKTKYTNLETYIHAHGTACADGDDGFDKELERYHLADFYWQEIASRYNYEKETPSIYDFLIEIFNHNFTFGEKTNLKKEASYLLALWKDTVQYRPSFGKISTKIAADIDVEGQLQTATIDELIQEDAFKIIDNKLIGELVQLITAEAMASEKVIRYIKQRENKFWYSNFQFLYQSLHYATEMIGLIRQYGNHQYASFDEGAQHYSSTLQEIDYTYRKFIWNYRQTNQDRILANLAEKVEKIYANDWLLAYNDNWQKVVDKLVEWPTQTRKSQQRFFLTKVKPILDKKQRVFVVISDALRYECGVELTKKLQGENRLQASVDYMISSLPSYTQLGMASLLPHKKLSFKDKSDTIISDGLSSIGIAGRTKILATNSGVRGTAIRAEDFMKMNAGTAGRAFVKDYDLIYIYHNQIDDAGDHTTSEDKVFEAVENELHFLVEITKKIANMNGTNILITADHGFIYQHQVLDNSDFSVSNHKGEIWKENRRFVIGQNLSNDAATKSFKGAQLNIGSEVDVLIPKSVNRLRVKGAGSRFIHGGAAMQEIMIPIISVTKKKKDTVSQVAIDLIKSSEKITTNILAISFIQNDLVTDTVLSRKIKAALYAEDGEILSDVFRYNFDIDEGSERQREVKYQFNISAKAVKKYKNQRVKLILEEPLEGTNKWKLYKDYGYTLNISFMNDFDF